MLFGFIERVIVVDSFHDLTCSSMKLRIRSSEDFFTLSDTSSIPMDLDGYSQEGYPIPFDQFGCRGTCRFAFSLYPGDPSGTKLPLILL